MTERALILDDDRVRSLLEGARSIILPMRNQPSLGDALSVTVHNGGFHDDEGGFFRSPVGDEGEVIWVREAFRAAEDGTLEYRADHPGAQGSWTSPVRMRRDQARLVLEVVSVRAVPLHRAGSYLDPDTTQDVKLAERLLEMHQALNGDPWVWVVWVKSVSGHGAPDGAAPRADAPAWKPDYRRPDLPFTMDSYTASTDLTLLRLLGGKALVFSGLVDAFLRPTRENADVPVLLTTVLDGSDADVHLLARSLDMYLLLEELGRLKAAEDAGFMGGITREEYERRAAAAWAALPGLLAQARGDNASSVDGEAP